MRSHIWALAALAGLAAAAATARAQADPKTVVATVNGRNITLGEVDAVLKERQVPEAEIPQARYEAACLLVDGVLWEQYLQKNGAKIAKAEVNKRFAELLQAVKKAGKTMEEYYKETGQSEASVRAGIVSVLQWDAIAHAKVTDAQVRRYYDENRDLFDKVLVHARHIVLRVSPNASPAEKLAVRNNLLAIRAHILAGEFDFAEAAKRFSQDTTAPQGGDLGTFGRKMYWPESITRAAFALPVNVISDAIETEDGLHLFLVIERKAPQPPPEFEKIKDTVGEFCAGELRLAVMQQLRQAAKVQFNLPK
ncbi:MAG TPA: peptidylprolyl isomerase [Gemmataceae bacterium]|nr:peptidylprolyl isomerase [Gemmataceae bacterium]